jgi:hypothetical protein
MAKHSRRIEPLLTTGTIATIAAAVGIAVIIALRAEAKRRLGTKLTAESKRGAWRLPFLASLPCRLGSALTARMFRERLAPRERCVLALVQL